MGIAYRNRIGGGRFMITRAMLSLPLEAQFTAASVKSVSDPVIYAQGRGTIVPPAAALTSITAYVLPGLGLGCFATVPQPTFNSHVRRPSVTGMTMCSVYRVALPGSA